MRHADLSSRGVLPTVVCLKPRHVHALAHWGLLNHEKVSLSHVTPSVGAHTTAFNAQLHNFICFFRLDSLSLLLVLVHCFCLVFSVQG